MNEDFMKIISWNVNGIRAVYKKGFLDWLNQSNADIVCLQEIKAGLGQIPDDLLNSISRPITSLFKEEPKEYLSYFNPAVKPGYAGTAVFTKEKPLQIETKIGLKRFDQEGRVLILKYPDFSLINLYLPHGGREKENLDYKLEVYNHLLRYLQKTRDSGDSDENSDLNFYAYAQKFKSAVQEKIILLGDFNVAHQDIDLARPKENRNNTMFTPEERKQIDSIIELGFVDTLREFHKEGGHYTWWPYFASARERNLGWRIDYCFTSKSLTPKLKDAFILPEVMGSDHCPVGTEIDV